MSGAHGESHGHGFGTVLITAFLCIIGMLIIVALLLPKETTQFFLMANERIMSFFNSSLFVGLRFTFGILTVGLAGLTTWLFFRLLEMEKEHEDHVYHHAHIHEENRTHDHEKQTIHIDHPITSKVDTHEQVYTKESITSQETQSSSEAQHKTAAPPSRLPGESGVRGSQIGEKQPAHFQWQSVLRLATSSNPSDWKIDMMTYMQGIEGQTLGERLKNADTGSFTTLKYAKAAHHLRNQIAHEPTLQLTPRDINQTIRMYEAVFNEFKYI
jgi:hypothetical protein